MAAMIPMAMFGLEVPPGDFPISGNEGFKSAFRITMAAIDPSATIDGAEGALPRATLKILRIRGLDDDEYDSDEFDADEFENQMLNGDDEDEDEDEDEEDDSEEEDDGAGPSDPLKSKKARKAAAQKAIEKLLKAEGMDLDSEDDDAELTNGVNGTGLSAKALGKLRAEDDSEDDEDDEDDEKDDADIQEFVVCTLDPSKNYQQPLDITIGDDERVFFKVSGTHSVYLTGNYVADAETGFNYDDETDSDEEDEYDLEPDLDELDDYDEEDLLDDLEDPRVTELEGDDEVPTLIKAADKKADKKSKKRPAEEEIDGLDDAITKANASEGANGEQKLSKKQLKKLKKTDGTAAAPVEAAKAETKAGAEAPSSANKKVQFAKNLEQGPTPTKDAAKPADKTADKAKAGQATLGIKKVQGVTIDDKKIGTGPAAKAGDRVDMRYIGKLEKDNKVFDANKKGKPFTFKLGAGEVIKGWDIGIAGMSVGGERRIIVPAHLGYGGKGAPPDIPGNAGLIFDVKLLEIKRK